MKNLSMLTGAVFFLVGYVFPMAVLVAAALKIFTRQR